MALWKSHSEPDAELIVDREVARTDEDRLNHDEIAAQLEQLTRSVPTPSNIALYGPWGSGKSGIANLLEQRLNAVKGVKFVRFDAFKYAENPLRRNFISATAKALKNYKSKYHSDLYSGTTTTGYNLPKSSIFTLGGLFGVTLLMCAILILGIVAIFAAFQSGPYWTDFGAAAKTAGTSALLPATILTAIVAFIGKSFVVEKKTEKAESHEQFEKVFQELVDETPADRIVIFVDELDRCAPAEIVSTLDAVRTFLDVKKCVFIVATDQQVLEQALTKNLSQATPADPTNPYYSAGSAYLDKVFQYQIAIPPLLPQSVTRFAADLVRAKPGVWSEIDIDLIVSILIPSHVRSPRRVKNLLNAFVLAYRLAKAREREKILSTDVSSRVDEIAKLVCFRVEFPLFARDLLADARLPEYVLYHWEKPNGGWSAYPNVSESVKELAVRYASLKQPVDHILASTATAKESGDENNGTEEEQRERVLQSQGQQLIDYLSRTRSVQYPRRDLIHLQSTGNVFGLDGPVADSVDQFAQDGALQRLQNIFMPLSSEARASVVSFLIQQVRSAIGVEAINVARSILHLITVDKRVLETRADTFIEAVAPVFARSPEILDKDTLPGAWSLSLASERHGALTLRSAIITQDSLYSSIELFGFVIRSAKAALSANLDRTIELTIDHLVSQSHHDFVEILMTLEREDAEELTKRMERELSSSLKISASKYKKAKAEAAATTSAAPASPADPLEVFDPYPVIASIGEWLDWLLERYPVAAENVIRTVLSVDDQECRSLVQERLPKITTLREASTAALVVTSAQRRNVSTWRGWLRTIDEDALSDPRVTGALNSIGSHLWRTSIADSSKNTDIATIRDAANALADMIQAVPSNSAQKVDLIEISLGDAATDEDTLIERERRLKVAEIFTSAGLSNGNYVAAQECAGLTECLQADLAAQEAGSPLTNYVLRSAPWALNALKHEDSATEQVQIQLELISAVDECEWLAQIDHILLQLRCRSTLLPSLRNQISGSLPSASELAMTAQSETRNIDEIASSWISITRPNVDDLITLVNSGPPITTSPFTLQAIQERRETFNPEDQLRLVSSQLASLNVNATESEPLLAAIGLHAVAPMRVAEILSERYKSCTTNPQRQRVLELWKAADITHAAARRHLIENVLIPFASLNSDRKNSGAIEIVLNFLQPLASPVPDRVKISLRDAIVGATESTKYESRATSILKNMGFRSRRKGFLLSRRDVIDTEEKG